jgi:hypothetical protein
VEEAMASAWCPDVLSQPGGWLLAMSVRSICVSESYRQGSGRQASCGGLRAWAGKAPGLTHGFLFEEAFLIDRNLEL